MATILVIDDAPPIVEMVTTVLQDEGYTVYGAESGRAGLALATQIQPDLVLSDIVMPDLPGDVLCQTLQQQGWERPIILMSANQRHRERADCLAAAFLAKPFDLDTLLGLIEHTLDDTAHGTIRPAPPA